eukprot:m.4018 g.4018  ORF g.4018 m.4018 type:complete len:697 (+) comp10081_c0_seq1:78-2168(+)
MDGNDSNGPAMLEVALDDNHATAGDDGKTEEKEKPGASQLVHFEQMQGPGGLNAIVKRFAHALEVVRCANEFYKRLADIEEGYASSLQKLLRSPPYTFKRNLIQQLLGSNEAEELGTLDRGWKLLGLELEKLRSHHLDKAKNLRERVRFPLEKALPQLEKTKTELTLESKTLSRDLAVSEKSLLAEKKMYLKMSEDTERLRRQIAKLEDDVFSNPAAVPKLDRARLQLAASSASTFTQERKYRDTVDEHCRKQKQFELRSGSIARRLSGEETDRSQLLKKSFQELARVLSDTCPTYLEGMQRMIMFTDNVSALEDMGTFVDTCSQFKDPLVRPKFEPFQSKFIAAPREPKEEGDTKPVIPVKPAKEKRDHAAEFFKNVNDSSPIVKWSPQSQPANEHSVVQPAVFSDPAKAEDQAVFPPPVLPPKPQPSNPDSSSEKSSSDKIPVVSSVVPGPESPPEAAPGETSDDDLDDLLEQVKKAENSPHQKPRPPPKTWNTNSSADNILDSITSFKKKGRQEQKVEQPPPSADPKPGISPKPKPPPPSKPKTPEGMLKDLVELGKKNDFYGLFGATAATSKTDLAKLRRDKTVLLHPDRFNNDEAAKQRATTQLAELNRIYADVLTKERPKYLYSQLVSFRKNYLAIATQSPDRLSLAVKRFEQLRTDLTRAHVPACLMQELSLAVKAAQAYEKQKTSTSK